MIKMLNRAINAIKQEAVLTHGTLSASVVLIGQCYYQILVSAFW